jgi:hypothetical protein
MISWKLALFYLTTIALTIALFIKVTEYGEANLKAQPKITGRYSLTIPDMPSCLQGSMLAIEQSGQFINAVILTEADLKAPPAKNGRLKQFARISGNFAQGVNLSGRDRQVGNCFATVVEVNGTIKPGGKIVGTLQLNESNPQGFPPATVLNRPTYNNGNPQTLKFHGQKKG